MLLSSQSKTYDYLLSSNLKILFTEPLKHTNLQACPNIRISTSMIFPIYQSSARLSFECGQLSLKLYKNQIVYMKIQQNHREQSQKSLSPHFSSLLLAQSYPEQCPICCRIRLLHCLTQCEHSFCEECIQLQIDQQLTRLTKISCPEESCRRQLTTDMPYYAKLTQEQQRKYAKMNAYYQILSNPSLKHCKMQDCLGLIDTNQTKPTCSLCGLAHCRDCLQFAHVGQCEVLVAVDLQMRQKYRQCSQCGQIIEKTEGCTHMSCNCGHYFCYSCGETLNGPHVCQAPDQLNFLQKYRWEIQHVELWYESGQINFLQYLNLISPQRKQQLPLKILWTLLYGFVFLPLTLVLALAAFIIVNALVISLFVIFTLVLPFMGIFEGNNLHFFPTELIVQDHGTFAGLIIVLALYPLLYFINLGQFLYRAFVLQQFTVEEFCIFWTDMMKGIRNFALMPCLMLFDNEQFYLDLARSKPPLPPSLD